jgi:hypothetical protein
MRNGPDSWWSCRVSSHKPAEYKPCAGHNMPVCVAVANADSDYKVIMKYLWLVQTRDP